VEACATSRGGVTRFAYDFAKTIIALHYNNIVIHIIIIIISNRRERLSVVFRCNGLLILINTSTAGIPSLVIRWTEQTAILRAARISRSPRFLTHRPKHIFNSDHEKYELGNLIHLDTPLYTPWRFGVNLDLHRFPKNSTCPIIYRNIFKENCSLAHLQTLLEWLSYVKKLQSNGNSQLLNICRWSFGNT
jgi:hypothetical protein